MVSSFMLESSILLIVTKSIYSVKCFGPKVEVSLKNTPNRRTQATINLVGVVVAVTEQVPRVLVVDHDGASALPNGPFLPDEHSSLEDGLRLLLKAQTGLNLFYVEQLYTFGNRYRTPAEIDGGPREISVAYIALTHEAPVSNQTARWADWYDFLPWEDWRNGSPESIPSVIQPNLEKWVRKAKNLQIRRECSDRVRTTFGNSNDAEMDAVLALERFELLYEAELVQESRRDSRTRTRSTATIPAIGGTGIPMMSDHRRVLATALGRLRGKLAYRPVVFELLPGEFTLLHLQGVAEALSGAKLHKQNFRRLVLNADLVEPIGRAATVGRGRPAELFRFRREVLGEKLTVGLSRPRMRKDGV